MLKWADTMPSGRIRDRLAAWDREFGPQTRSRFFAPSAYLHHRADKGLKLVPLSARPLKAQLPDVSASLNGRRGSRWRRPSRRADGARRGTW